MTRDDAQDDEQGAVAAHSAMGGSRANLAGGVLFAFPNSRPPGRLAALPAAVPALYRAMTALFILLFGAAYAWLASRPSSIASSSRSGRSGKACAFLVVVGLWLAGQAAPRSVLVMSADLVLAALFVFGLRGLEPSRPGG